MKKFMFALLIGLTMGSAAMAQKPEDESPPPPVQSAPAVQPGVQPARDGSPMISMGQVVPTPEMWFYEQERRRHDDPSEMVRANAESRAAERHARMNAMAWYGLSNARPQCSPDPVHGNYAPRWSANGYMPSQWIGGGGSTVILQADRTVPRY